MARSRYRNPSGAVWLIAGVVIGVAVVASRKYIPSRDYSLAHSKLACELIGGRWTNATGGAVRPDVVYPYHCTSPNAPLPM